MLIHQMKELYSNYCVIFIVTPELSAVIIFTFVSDRQKCSKIISQYLRCLKSNFTVLFLLETRSEREGHTNYTLQVIKTLTTPLWSSEEEGSREIKLISKPKAHIWIDLYMFFVFFYYFSCMWCSFLCQTVTLVNLNIHVCYCRRLSTLSGNSPGRSCFSAFHLAGYVNKNRWQLQDVFTLHGCCSLVRLCVFILVCVCWPERPDCGLKAQHILSSCQTNRRDGEKCAATVRASSSLRQNSWSRKNMHSCSSWSSVWISHRYHNTIIGSASVCCRLYEALVHGPL